MNAAFCFVAIGTVPFMGFDLSLTSGGPATALVSWLVITWFTLLTTCSLAEMASQFPNCVSTIHTRNVQRTSDCSWPSVGCDVPLGGATGGSRVGAGYKLLDRPIARNRESWRPDIMLNYHG